MTKHYCESLLAGKRWYFAVVVYFVALLIVLYYIGSLLLHSNEDLESKYVRKSKVTYGNQWKSRLRDPRQEVKQDHYNDETRYSDKSNGIHNEEKETVNLHNGQNIIIMCLIFTTPEEYDRKALAVKLTWAKRCNYYAFFYSKKDHVHLEGAYALDVPEGRAHLTTKTMKAFRISYEKYKDTVDWYLKADDDTYYIMENLRYLLTNYDSNEALYIGHKSTDFLKNGYNSGGAGYLLSKAAAKHLVEQSDAFPNTCHVEGGTEDFDMGRCLETFRIFPQETRDQIKRIKFHPDHPLRLLLGDKNSAYQYTKQNYTFGNPKGIKVMSPDTVSFHYMEPGHIYMYDFLLYDLNRH